MVRLSTRILQQKTAAECALRRAPKDYAAYMDAHFGPEHRLHNNRDYGRIFNRNQKAAGKHVVLLLRPRDKREANDARLGVMISTKTASAAVRRHQLKRWVRELFRTTWKERLRGFDLVVLFRQDPPADGHLLLNQELEHVLMRAMTATPQPRKKTNGNNKSP
jgi:ribonuclease P protein component